MSKKYKEKLDELLKEDPTYISKLYLLYELEAWDSIENIDDDTLSEIYYAYLDNKNYNSIYDFVLAIQNWCDCNETSFSEITDIKKMLEEIE